MIFARMKLYTKDPDDVPKDLFKKLQSENVYSEYKLQIHLYQGRSFPAADETGASDPFIVFRSMG